MSKEEDRIKNSRRRQQDDNAVNRQVKIAQAHHAPVDEPHKFAKHHAMNCGDPRCVMCANPRRTFKTLTAQEQRLFQDLDSPNDRHSNGLPPKQD
jgi:serine/threonine protein phosphatase PrpC